MRHTQEQTGRRRAPPGSLQLLGSEMVGVEVSGDARGCVRRLTCASSLLRCLRTSSSLSLTESASSMNASGLRGSAVGGGWQSVLSTSSGEVDWRTRRRQPAKIARPTRNRNVTPVIPISKRFAHASNNGRRTFEQEDVPNAQQVVGLERRREDGHEPVGRSQRTHADEFEERTTDDRQPQAESPYRRRLSSPTRGRSPRAPSRRATRRPRVARRSRSRGGGGCPSAR